MRSARKIAAIRRSVLIFPAVGKLTAEIGENARFDKRRLEKYFACFGVFDSKTSTHFSLMKQVLTPLAPSFSAGGLLCIFSKFGSKADSGRIVRG